MASYYFSPIGNSQQLSTTGAPLNAGTITTFQAGTSTPQATYTDNAGSNPSVSLTLNTYGLPSSPVWLLGGQAYKFVIKDSLGNTIRTLDNVTGINDVTSVQSGSVTYLTGVAGTNTITASLTGLTAYVAGEEFRFLAAGANTGAATININGLGAKAITKNVNGALVAGDIAAGAMVGVRYDGTQFQITNLGVSAPAFGAYQNVLQSLANGAPTKIQLQTKEFDTATAFDSATNYRFQPLVAGYYQFNGATTLTASSASAFVSLYKNGAEFKRGNQSGSAAVSGTVFTVSSLISLNGSTDYVELFCAQNSGGAVNTSPAQFATYLNGFLARPA